MTVSATHDRTECLTRTQGYSAVSFVEGGNSSSHYPVLNRLYAELPHIVEIIEK
jgi:hypothetical protein